VPPYVTVFDISKQPFEWWWPAIGIVIFASGIVLIKLAPRWPNLKNAKVVGWVMLVFGPIFTIVVYNSVNSMWADWRSAYERGSYFTVEGVVKDFKPMPYEGHQEECFRVNNQQFCYSDYIVQPGFRQSASHGGPIREGLPVRIYYYEGQILRLDIRADMLPSEVARASYAKAEEAKWYDWVRNDPTNDRMGLALAFAFVLISLCWNLDWRHYMRYWIRKGPPYSALWELVFRASFLLTFVGSTVSMVRMIEEKHRTAADFQKAALYSLFWLGFFGIFDLVLRIRLRFKNKSASDNPTVGDNQPLTR